MVQVANPPILFSVALAFLIGTLIAGITAWRTMRLGEDGAQWYAVLALIFLVAGTVLVLTAEGKL
ncbi:hypothetical protein HK19_03030 [Acetobacter persici]|uniref:hypothetical protein n=1 Tax=Acetobacter persici TaxID=1076596 RepID=UPI000A3B8ABA|nr:hypothetical protein [Acetobacter persici]OUI86178.1 hypothetical protein HK19_03030 [Acetobacter persici]